uniref:CCHC-type domain-containing protein n=1 Tax=Hucho hucho TaxID=62062 RepID=A0A4W5KFP9_9TELE
MLLLRSLACLLTSAFWIIPLYDDRSDCSSGFDPLPALSFMSKESALNKPPHLDSNSASAYSLRNTSPAMNPAETLDIQAAFAYQSEVLKGYQEQLTTLQSVNEHLTSYIQSLPPPTPKTVSFALPDKFNGNAEQCKGFVRQIQLFLDHQGDAFESEEGKCAFLMTLLTGRAIEWAAAVWDSDSRLRYSMEYFIQLREVFEYPAGGQDVSTRIMNITQGNRTAAEYAIEFRTLAAQSGWNDIALKAMFHRSLNTELQTELACKGEDFSFSEFVTLAIKIDNLMSQAPKRRSRWGTQRNSLMPITIETCPHNEPMQLNVSRLSEGERERRQQLHLCYYCGEAGHGSLGCPRKPQTIPRVTIEHFSLLSNKSFTLPITLRTDTLYCELTAMIDSGAALNLINKDLVTKYDIPIQPCTP